MGTLSLLVAPCLEGFNSKLDIIYKSCLCKLSENELSSRKFDLSFPLIWVHGFDVRKIKSRRMRQATWRALNGYNLVYNVESPNRTTFIKSQEESNCE